MPGLRFAADPLPGWRHGAGRGARSATLSQGCGWAASTATSSSTAVAAERVIDAFTDGRLDVLVGTSLVAKGLDIPSVTLVGVVSSDVALNLPDERAAERTYQLLVQAIGRAGRGALPGRAILQTYQPDHPAIMAAATGDRTAFYDAELALRERFGSPPFGRLVKLTVGLTDPGRSPARGRDDAGRLRERRPRAERGLASRSSARHLPTSPDVPTAGAGMSSCAGRIRSACLMLASRLLGRWTWIRSRCSDRMTAGCPVRLVRATIDAPPHRGAPTP